MWNNADKLSKLSEGKNEIVCNFKNRFINFDRLKGVIPYPKPPMTPDMLYINRKKSEVVFVEFKSNEEKNLKTNEIKFQIKRKILDGIIVFYEIFKEKFCNFQKIYILVYRNFKNPEMEVMNYFSNELYEYYNLEELEKKFLKASYVMNCDELRNFFKTRFGISFRT